MKILLVQHQYFLNGIGGTEKVCSEIANIFSRNGHCVEIATNEDITGEPVFPLHDGVSVINIFDPTVEQKEEIPIYNYRGSNPFLWFRFKIQKKYVKWHNGRLKQRMGGERKLYEYNLRHRSILWKNYIDQLKPDLIITMSIGSLLEISYGNIFKMPIIDSVNGRPDYDYSNVLGGRKDYLVDLLTQSFKHLAGIQLLFDSYRNYLPSTFYGECKIIANAVQQTDSDQLVAHNRKKARYKIIHIGRLDIACKQQNVAIKIFSDIAFDYPEWDLEIWGTGTDFERLNLQIEDLGLSDRIFLRGFTDNPMSQMRAADIFIFPSKYEGFGLALAEAMSCGLPSIGFSFCSGVNEIIKHRVNGFLAKDTEEMRGYLEQLITTPRLRKEIGLQASLAVKNYTLSQMESGWNELIKNVLNKHINNNND